MKRNKLLLGIILFILVMLLSPALRGDYEWTYILTSLDSHDFQPARNIYHWNGTGKWSDNSWHYEYSITLIYYKVPKNLSIEISRRHSVSGEISEGKFSAPCSNDPVLYDGVTCGPIKNISGNTSALPEAIARRDKPLCSIGALFFPPGTRESLRGEYHAINEGPWTLAPLPVSPKENSTQHSPVTFEAFLPFHFALPCGGWSLTLLLECSDPSGGSYPWKKVDTGDPIKSYEGDNFQCCFQKKMALTPGKYRFKMQAKHYQKGKTPWSLPFEFSVTLKISPEFIKAERIVITAPKAGDVWKIRTEPYYVNWKTYGLPAEVMNGPVKILLRQGNQTVKPLRKSTTAKIGATRVYLKSDFPTGEGFYIRIRSKVDGSYFSDSGQFSIIRLMPVQRVKKK